VPYIPTPPPPIPIIAATRRTCPARIEELGQLLVRDLPSYTNRAIQKRRKLTNDLYTSIVTAGKPDAKPLPISSREYTPVYPQAAPNQLFITTLERQYAGVNAVELQKFHWLFLARTKLGWRLVTMYSRSSQQPRSSIVPPTESTNTPVGEAVRTWLNDCYISGIK
jgi:hypothetical protein